MLHYIVLYHNIIQIIKLSIKYIKIKSVFWGKITLYHITLYCDIM